MKLEIIKEKEMPLFERKRVTAQVVFQGATPRKSDIRKDIAKKLKIDEKLVAIRHVFQKFGETTAKVIAHAYKDFDRLCSLEKDGKNIKADIKKAEAPKEEPKPEKKPEKGKAEEKPEEKEAPKEEKAEEKKEEAPKEASEKPKENKKEEKGES